MFFELTYFVTGSKKDISKIRFYLFFNFKSCRLIKYWPLVKLLGPIHKKLREKLIFYYYNKLSFNSIKMF